MKTVPSKDEFLIDILGTQKPDDAQEDVIHVTTVGGYLATKTGNKLIRYKEYDPENPSLNLTTVIKVEENQISITRNGDFKGQLILELDKRHQCYYPTPLGSVTVGIYTKKMDIDMDSTGGKISVAYTLDFDSSVVSENTFDISVRKN